MKKNVLLVIACLFLATTISFAQTQPQTPKPAPARPAADIGIEIAPIPDQTFTGTAITPEPDIKYGTIVLKKDVDYTLSYTNNINVGSATLTITGKGNYRDTKTINFNIVPKSFGSAVTPGARTAPAATAGSTNTATPAPATPR